MCSHEYQMAPARTHPWARCPLERLLSSPRAHQEGTEPPLHCNLLSHAVLPGTTQREALPAPSLLSSPNFLTGEASRSAPRDVSFHLLMSTGVSRTTHTHIHYLIYL